MERQSRQRTWSISIATVTWRLADTILKTYGIAIIITASRKALCQYSQLPTVIARGQSIVDIPSLVSLHRMEGPDKTKLIHYSPLQNISSLQLLLWTTAPATQGLQAKFSRKASCYLRKMRMQKLGRKGGKRADSYTPNHLTLLSQNLLASYRGFCGGLQPYAKIAQYLRGWITITKDFIMPRDWARSSNCYLLSRHQTRLL